MVALVGTGGHVEDPEADYEEPDEANQPGVGGHFVLLDSGEDVTDKERDHEGGGQGDHDRDVGGIEEGDDDHHHDPRTDGHEAVNDDPHGLLRQVGAYYLIFLNGGIFHAFALLDC